MNSVFERTVQPVGTVLRSVAAPLLAGGLYALRVAASRTAVCRLRLGLWPRATFQPGRVSTISRPFPTAPRVYAGPSTALFATSILVALMKSYSAASCMQGRGRAPAGVGRPLPLLPPLQGGTLTDILEIMCPRNAAEPRNAISQEHLRRMLIDAADTHADIDRRRSLMFAAGQATDTYVVVSDHLIVSGIADQTVGDQLVELAQRVGDVLGVKFLKGEVNCKRLYAVNKAVTTNSQFDCFIIARVGIQFIDR